MRVLNPMNVKLFAKKKQQREHEDKNSDIRYLLDSFKYQNYSELLQKAERAYTSFSQFRRERQRNIRYMFGDQDLDLIVDPDYKYGIKYITEREYQRRRGIEPSKYNIIGKSVKSITGLYENSRPEPRASARNTDNRITSDMMSVAINFVAETEEMKQLDSASLKEALISGMYVRSEYYGVAPNSGAEPNVIVTNEDPNLFFADGDFKDTRMRDETLIGMIRDMSLGELLRRFARSKKEAKTLREAYSEVTDFVSSAVNGTEINSEDNYFLNKGFYNQPTGKCRVYEIWNKESKESYAYHDFSDASFGYFEEEDLEKVKLENEMRKKQMLSLGMEEDDAQLIEYEYEVRSRWVYYFLTPLAKCIYSGETPYEHNSHAFTLSLFPLIDGQVHSPVSELLDTQRAINRVMTQMDLMRQHQARGVWLIPTDAVPTDMTRSEFSDQFTNVDGVTYYQPSKTSTDRPHQITTQGVQMGDIEIIRFYMQLNDDISGVSNALRGEKPDNGTPASLYKLQTDNSAVNIAEFMGWFNRANAKCYYKIMRLIQQFWDEERYINLSGKDYSEEAKHWNPSLSANIVYDLTVEQVTKSPSAAEAIDVQLSALLDKGMIDIKTYLQNSSMPFASKVLDAITTKEQNGEPINGQQILDQAGVPQANPKAQQIMDQARLTHAQ